MLSKNKHGFHEDMCRFCINSAFERDPGPTVAHMPDLLLDTIIGRNFGAASDE